MIRKIYNRYLLKYKKWINSEAWGENNWKLNMISYLNWALNLAKSSWLVNRKGNMMSFVFICVYFIFLVRSWILWEGEKCIFTCSKFYRKKWERSGIGQEEKFGCTGVTRRTQLTPQGCSEAEVALRDTPGWGEILGPCLLALMSSWMWCALRRKCVLVEGLFSREYSWEGQQTTLLATEGINSSVLKKDLGGTGQNC